MDVGRSFGHDDLAQGILYQGAGQAFLAPTFFLTSAFLDDGRRASVARGASERSVVGFVYKMPLIPYLRACNGEFGI